METGVSYFSADMLCAAAYAAALDRGDSQRCIVLMECAASGGIVAAVAEAGDNRVTLVLPVPALRRDAHHALHVFYPGLECCVTMMDSAGEEMMPPVLLVRRNADSSALRIQLKAQIDVLPETLVSSGLAAVSAAIDMADDLQDGVIEYGIGMPGGTVEVGVSKRDGKLFGVSVCCPVSSVEESS